MDLWALICNSIKCVLVVGTNIFINDCQKLSRGQPRIYNKKKNPSNDYFINYIGCRILTMRCSTNSKIILLESFAIARGLTVHWAMPKLFTSKNYYTRACQLIHERTECVVCGWLRVYNWEENPKSHRGYQM